MPGHKFDCSDLLDCTIIVPTTLYIGLSGVSLGECNSLHTEETIQLVV